MPRAMHATNRWLQGFQYFRAIAICEVIVLHTAMIVQLTGLATLTPQKGIVVVVWVFTSFAVYHFLFISGAVLYNKYSGGFSSSKSLSTFYKKRLSTVVPPYLVWSTFYFFYPYVGAVLLFSVFNYPTATYSSLSNIAQLLSEYLTGLAVGVEHLWFIPLIIQLYLIFPLLVKLYNRFSKRGDVIILSLLFVIQLAYWGLFMPAGPTPFRVIFLSGIFYFVFVFYISAHYDSVKHKLTKVNISLISFAVILATIYYAAISYRVLLSSVTVPPIPVPTYYVWLDQLSGPFYCLLLIVFLKVQWKESARTPLEYTSRRIFSRLLLH